MSNRDNIHADQRPVSEIIFRMQFAKNGGEGREKELLENIKEVLWGRLESVERDSIVKHAFEQVGLQNPQSLLVLHWIHLVEDGQESWAELARQQGVNRSTITRSWLPKAVRLFINAFLTILQIYLCEVGQESDWDRIGRYFD